MKWVVAVSVLLLVGCSTPAPDEAAPASPTVVETAATEPSAVPSSPVSTSPVPDEPALISEVTMLDPPDEDAYIRALQQREPDRMTQFDTSELMELGVVACNATAGYVHGSSPTPGDEVLKAMRDRGHDVELSEWIAPDIRNAARDTICDVELVEQG